jgi:formylglycine-generating enzyme required for sulfatase activity
VVNVNWNDAQLYLAWLKTHTGYEYRLLSEAEWEYAARAGQVGVYAWGDAIGDHHANCLNCGGLTKEEGTRAVGSFAANGYSIFDMHGNVREWVADCWHENYQGAPQDGSAWVNQCSEASRVVRGGAWNNAAQDLRAAARHREIWDKRADNIGFRVARVVP